MALYHVNTRVPRDKNAADQEGREHAVKTQSSSSLHLMKGGIAGVHASHVDVALFLRMSESNDDAYMVADLSPEEALALASFLTAAAQACMLAKAAFEGEESDA